MAMSSRLGAILPWIPWKNSRDSVSDGDALLRVSRPGRDFRLGGLALRVLLNPLEDFSVALAGRKLLLERVGLDADEIEEAVVHGAGVMVFAVVCRRLSRGPYPACAAG